MHDDQTYQQPSRPTGPSTPESNSWGAFTSRFPDGASVYAWFAPAHWERFAGTIDGRVAARPCPTLHDVGSLYHDPDLPRALVRSAISGLASLSSASFNVSQQAVELAVGQFIGRYARRCTLYQLMSYAANYGDYKRTLSSFDLNDVISGFQRFEQRWHEAADKATVPNASRNHPEGGKADGLLSLARYVRRAATEHPLFVHGFCRDSHFVKRVPGDPDSRTEQEQEERDRQEVESVGETYYGGLRVGLCEIFTPEDVRQAIRSATEREAAAYLGEAIRRHFRKNGRKAP